VTFYAGPERGALALVESPAQLLNIIELGQHEDDLVGIKIAVLAPTAGLTRTQLRSMITLARDAGHAVSWHEPRLGGLAVARSLRAVAGELAGVRRLVIGDPYSGVIQVIINVTKLCELTVVDDRMATLEFARQWMTGSTSHAGTELQRPASVGTLPRRRGTRSLEHWAAGRRHTPIADCGCSPVCRLTYRASVSFATTSLGCALDTRRRS
jgi:hypothetical protein